MGNRQKINQLIDSIPDDEEIQIFFIKADGSDRSFRFTKGQSLDNRKGLNKGDKSHVMGAISRLEIHENLLPVYSIEDNGYRQVNLDTVYMIKAQGKTTLFR